MLITGESGTGKELVAKALHENSGRKPSKPFIKINCAAIPKTLMESELFGYEKGAFTGASSTPNPGASSWPTAAPCSSTRSARSRWRCRSSSCARFRNQEFERVGGIKTLKVERAADHRHQPRSRGRDSGMATFREDLYYRLNVVPLKLPPLRERRSDIPLLAHYIIHKFNDEHNKTIEGISDEAMERLCERSWPGNIRELENVLERTILFCSGTRIESDDLPVEQPSESARPDPSNESAPVSEPLTGDTSLKDIVRAKTSEVEKELITQALDETGGNVTQAAKLLKISRKSLQMKMKEFGLRDRENGT